MPDAGELYSENWRPVRTEDDFVLEVMGEVPREIAGAYIRNGPNPQFEPRGAFHPFVGDGMLHGFFLENGTVRYRNRYVRTPRFVAERAAGRALFGSMDNPRDCDPLSVGVDANTANTSVIWHAGSLLALQETNRPFRVDPESLDSIGYAEAYAGRVTAHPKIDPNTGEMLWFAYDAGERPFSTTMAFGVTAPTGEVVRRETFEAPYCAMVHDFLITPRFVLFQLCPVTGDLQRVMRGGPPWAWSKDLPAYLGVMSRERGVGSLRWFATDPCHFYHPMNAWEEGDTVHVDALEFPHAPLIVNSDGSMSPEPRSRLRRWSVNLADASPGVRRTTLDDTNGEVPRIDERYTGLPYRHGWFAASRRRAGLTSFDALVHVDVVSGQRQIHDFAPGDVPGEPLFIPRAADAGEGEGWVVSIVYRGAAERSELAVFNALDLAEGPLAVARLPRRVPFGTHATWRPA